MQPARAFRGLADSEDLVTRRAVGLVQANGKFGLDTERPAGGRVCQTVTRRPWV